MRLDSGPLYDRAECHWARMAVMLMVLCMGRRVRWVRERQGATPLVRQAGHGEVGPHKIWKLTWFVFAIHREAIQRISILQPSHDAITEAVVFPTDSIYTDSCPSIVVVRTRARTQSRPCP